MNPIPTVQKIIDTVSDTIGQPNLGPDLQERLKHSLQQVLADMDLVTREEFDAQCKVLQHTRAKLEQLERELEALSSQVSEEVTREEDDET